MTLSPQAEPVHERLCPLCFLTAYHSNEAKRASSRDQGYHEHSLSILLTAPTGCGTSVLEVSLTSSQPVPSAQVFTE